MICPICESKDKWKNVDEFRIKPEGMCICEGCGFVSYPTKYKSKEEIVAHYRTDYRKRPNVGNLFTCNRKLTLHEAFIRDLFEKWKKENKTKPVMVDIGAAFGRVCAWWKQIFPEAEVYGTELTIGFKRVAYHEYGINLTDDIDTTKKYDLIQHYKVLEHMVDPHLELIKYRECLADDGFLYVSVPTWFGAMNNPGIGGFDIEYYYHPDHINSWSKKLFETLLKKCGFEILKYNGTMYGDTYLCKKNMEMTKVPLEFENPKEIIAKMDAIKKAWLCAQSNNYEEAVKHYPNYPMAYAGLFEKNRAKIHKGDPNADFETVFNAFGEPAIKNCPTSPEAFRLAADIAMRYEQFPKAIEFLDQGIKMAPNQSEILIAISHCHREMALRSRNAKEKEKLLKTASQICGHVGRIDMQAQNECINWIYTDQSEIPTPFEKEN